MEAASEKTCAYCDLPPHIDESNKEIKLKVCSRCKDVYYHDLECQKKHWKAGHKIDCDQTLAQRKKANGFYSSNKNVGNKKKITEHYSMDQVHQLVTRRFKELRSQGISTQDSMKQARDEFQPSEEHELDPGTKVASMFGMR